MKEAETVPTVWMMLQLLMWLFFFENLDAVEFLIHAYPKFVSVGSLPCDSPDEKVCHSHTLIIWQYTFICIGYWLSLSCCFLPPSHRLVWLSCFLRKGLFTLPNPCNGTSKYLTTSVFCIGSTVTVKVLICFLLSIEINHLLSFKMKHVIE